MSYNVGKNELVHAVPMNKGMPVAFDLSWFTVELPISAGIVSVCWIGSFLILGATILAFALGFGLGFVLGLVNLTGECSSLAMALTGISDTVFFTSISLLISMINYALH